MERIGGSEIEGDQAHPARPGQSPAVIAGDGGQHQREACLMFRKPFVFTLIVVLILAVSVYGATAQEPQSELAATRSCTSLAIIWGCITVGQMISPINLTRDYNIWSWVHPSWWS